MDPAHTSASQLSRRLERLPVEQICGVAVRVATDRRSRLLGLARLEAATAGDGLLIPRCRSVHTFGMRFELDIVFLDRHGRPIAVHEAVGPRRIALCTGARSVLELPSGRLDRLASLLNADARGEKISVRRP